MEKQDGSDSQSSEELLEEGERLKIRYAKYVIEQMRKEDYLEQRIT